jgi:CHAD domain-containing protein
MAGWDESKTVAANVRNALPRLMDDYFVAGRELVGSSVRPRALHRFRLKTKRVRYTLELFLEHYGPGLERRIDKLKDIQTLLGDINDCAATLELIEERVPRNAAHRKAAVKYLKKRARKKTDEFLDCWREQFDATGESAAWTNYLSRYTKRR